MNYYFSIEFQTFKCFQKPTPINFLKQAAISILVCLLFQQAVTGENVLELAGGEPKSGLRQNQHQISETANLKIALNVRTCIHIFKTNII